MDKKKVILNKGEYVFCSIIDINKISMNNIICSFKESEGYSIIILKEEAIKSGLIKEKDYDKIVNPKNMVQPA